MPKNTHNDLQNQKTDNRNIEYAARLLEFVEALKDNESNNISIDELLSEIDEDKKQKIIEILNNIR